MASGRNPYLFTTGVLGVPPYGAEGVDPSEAMERWQDEFLRAFPETPRHSVRSGHGVGKSTMIAWLALWFVLTHYDAKCVVTANSQDQLRDNNWPELRKWAAKLPEALRQQIQIDEERLFIKAAPEMSFAVRRTASKDRPEALQGIHAKHVLYLVDEASGIPDVVFDIAAGSLSTEGAMAALFSNPTRANGFFFSTHNELRSRWRCWHVSSETVRRATGHVEDFAIKYGRDSNSYRVRVLGEFPTNADETVIPRELVLSAKGRDVAVANVWPIWGVDVARFGDDTTTVVARQGNTLLTAYLREWRNLDGNQVAGRIIAMFNETPAHEKPRKIVVDTIGVGVSVYDILRQDGSPVREIVAGGNVAELNSISDDELRLRDAIWLEGRRWFEKRDCCLQVIPHAPEAMVLLEKLMGELTGPTFDFSPLGKRVVESKADMKKRGLKSPNVADGFLLTFLGGKHDRENPHRSRAPRGGTSWMAA